MAHLTLTLPASSSVTHAPTGSCAFIHCAVVGPQTVLDLRLLAKECQAEARAEAERQRGGDSIFSLDLLLVRRSHHALALSSTAVGPCIIQRTDLLARRRRSEEVPSENTSRAGALAQQRLCNPARPAFGAAQLCPTQAPNGKALGALFD